MKRLLGTQAVRSEGVVELFCSRIDTAGARIYGAAESGGGPTMPEKAPPVQQEMDWLHDERTDCFSALIKLPIGKYLDLVEDAHEQRGGISGQRDVLKTTTAKRIRDRMIADIRVGAVLPPVVIGVVFDPDTDVGLTPEHNADQDTFLKNVSKKELSIIDGMQRTASLMEAAKIDVGVMAREMRVEFWVAKSVRALVYRMLVLNTGQVPWTLARQLSVVYAPLLKEIRKNVNNLDRMFTPDKPGRRVGGGQFSSDSLVELYLAFSLRKINVDARESLSEEFSRLDFVDNLSDDAFQGNFYTTLSTLVDLDIIFDRYDPPSNGRLSRGKDIFGSQPARIGFVVAVAQYVVGRPGLERAQEERKARMETVTKNATALASKLSELNDASLGEFLRLDVLSEILDKKVGQVGRYERTVFNEAFKVLIEENFDVPNMEPCWRAS